VTQTWVALALIALTLLRTTTMTQAATNPTTAITNVSSAPENSTSVARLGMVSHGAIAIHPFIDVAAIQTSKIEIFVSDGQNNAQPRLAAIFWERLHLLYSQPDRIKLVLEGP
jgi:hypothetical protein